MADWAQSSHPTIDSQTNLAVWDSYPISLKGHGATIGASLETEARSSFEINCLSGWSEFSSGHHFALLVKLAGDFQTKK